MRAWRQRRVPSVLIRAALWLCASNVLVTTLPAQCTNPTLVPSQTISSGSPTFSDNNALEATGVTINGSASVTFVAGNCIHLGPGFRATGGTAPTTFHAWVQTAPSVISASPVTGSGLAQQFTWTASSPSGYANLAHLYAVFNTAVNGANACYIYYSRGANALFLADNAGATWTGGVAPGSAGFASNSQCTINGSGSSVNPSGNQLVLTVSVTFQPSFAGAKNNYLIAYDNAGLHTGWQQMGSWTVGGTSGAPSIMNVTPGSGGVGTAVMIAGTNFGATQGTSTVKFNGVTASVTGWSSTSITATVPSGATTGTVQVTVGGVQSNSVIFTVTSQETVSPPSQPTGPASGQVSTSYSFATGGSVSNLGHAVQYQFGWGDGTNSGWLPAGTTSASHTWTTAGTYNAAVIARCAADTSVTSVFSNSLTVTISTQPAGVTLVVPTNGASAQSSTPTFNWNAVSGATSYEFALGSPTPTVVASVSGTSYTQSAALSANTTYSWYVRAKSGSTTLGTSATWSFTTGATVPPAVTLLTPANGAANQDLTPTLTWKASAGATSYDVSLGSPTPTIIATVTSTNYTPAVPLAGTTTYSWRVTARNSGGSAPVSATWTFTTIPGAPTQVTLVSPANGASNQALTPTLTWSASSGATSYDVALGTPTPVVVGSVTTTSYTPASALSSGSAYSWYVIAKNTGGSAPQSATWTFMTTPGSSPPYPSREYVFLGGRVLGIENSATINGRVLQTGSGLSGVTLTLSGARNGSATTGSDGRYSFVNLEPGSYTVSPYRNGYTFTPGSSVLSVSNANLAVPDFTANGGTETVSTPNLPSGPSGALTNTSYSFTTGGSTSSLGNVVQYIFDWGDGTNSGWLPTGTLTASHSWSVGGTYAVTARARSAANPSVVSATSAPLSVVISQTYATLYISNSSLRVNDPWTAWLYSNIPNSQLTFCVRISGGAASCRNDYSPTNAAGYWTLSGTTPRQLGEWQEWIVFPNGTTSNVITFTVSDYANLAISNPTLHAGDPWVLWVTSSIPNTPFRVCVNVNSTGWSCTPYQYSTDGAGSQTLTGTTPAQPGNWQERVEFQGLATTSNTVSFTVIYP